MMRISVIIPIYNAEATIARALDSVLDQSEQPHEIICINDASTDESYTIIEEYLSRNKISAILIDLEENVGVGAARNVGISRATGDYIAFLDADDYWLPSKLEFQLQMLIDGNHDIVGGYSGDKDMSLNESSIEGRRVSVFSMSLINKYHTSSVLVKSSKDVIFPEGRDFLSEDFHLWLSLGVKGWKYGVHDLKLSRMIKHPYLDSGLSSNLWSMEKGELRAIAVLLDNKKLFNFVIAYCWSLLKFLVRVLKKIMKNSSNY